MLWFLGTCKLVVLGNIVASWGTFKADEMFLSRIAEHRSLATWIMDKVRFDNLG